jgi:hypothetical protein
VSSTLMILRTQVSNFLVISVTSRTIRRSVS